jgi:hypothetical protein
MEAAVAAVLGRAFHHVPAQQANQEIARVRQTTGSELTPGLSYEWVLPESDAGEHITARLLPRLVYYLECRGAHLPGCDGVFLSIFHRDQLYFVHARDAVEELSRVTGLSVEEMVQRYGDA